MSVDITIEDPTAPDVVALLERHLAFTREVTPAGGVFAFDLDALRQPNITFLCARSEGQLRGVAALHELDDHSAELKSMHTAAEVRGQGVARALVVHALDLAQIRGIVRVNLETGNFEAFAPARALYLSCGFVPCESFGPYVDSPTSACMTIVLPQPDA